MMWPEYLSRSSAISEGPCSALCQLKSCQLLHKCTKNEMWNACSRWMCLKVSNCHYSMSYKTRSTGTPAYLASLLENYRPARELHSSNKNLLTVPHLSLALSAKVFCVSAPTVWNSLSDACREAELVSTFRSRLKTELFNVAYVAQLV